MKKNNRKGFTIVELVIVIAVVGVLAAILIPTFVSLTNRARAASDDSLVKNLNTALKMAENDPTTYGGHAVSDENKTMHDAIVDLKYEGFLLENLVTRSEKGLLWDMKNNKFILSDKLEAEKAEHHLKDENYWKIVKSTSEMGNFSGYAHSDFSGEVNISAGFDVGETTNITAINYTNSEEKEVVIRTNGGYLTINAPSDTVNHYGEAEILDIQAINTASYHEFGKAGLARLQQGHFVVEAEGVVNVLYATGPKSGDTRVVVDNNNGTIGKAYATVTETANIYNGDAQEGQSGNVTLEKYDAVITEAVVTAMNSESIVEVLASEDSSVAAVKETIEAAVESSAFLGEGTEANPYIISSVNDLVKLSQKVAGGNSYEGEWFALSKDIDMKDVLWGADQGGDTINCIGTSGHPFKGNFDGNNKTVSNLSNGNKVTSDTYTSPTGKQVGNIFGLFGYVSGNVTIKNLTLTVDADVPSGKACGGLISNVIANSTLNVTGVTVSGKLYARSEKAAGFIGVTNGNSSVTMTDCVNDINVKAAQRIAGFISQTAGGDSISFNNCQNKGKIELTKVDDDYETGKYGVAAGFISHFNGATITYDNKCNNTGKIDAPLAANYHTYVADPIKYNGANTWVGSSVDVNVLNMLGIIQSSSSMAYATIIENALKAPNLLDGIFYTSENNYGVVSTNGSSFLTFDEAIEYAFNNWYSGGWHKPGYFVFNSNQVASYTCTFVSQGSNTYYCVDLNGFTLTTTNALMTSPETILSGFIRNGTIIIESTSNITSLFGTGNNNKFVISNLTVTNNTDHAINVNGTSVVAGETVVIGATN